jgi:two-component system cell cycle sensor histidine kinase/response regulator CckA
MADEQHGIDGEEKDLTGDKDQKIRLLEEQLFQARKLEAIGLASGVVAHDLNNFLTPILGYSTILKRELPEDHLLVAGVASIERAAERAARLINHLLESYQQVGQQKIPVDVSALVGDLLEDLRPRLTGNVDIQTKIATDAPAPVGDPQRLSRMLRNLAENALEAMGNGGALTITAEAVTLDDAFCKHHPGSKPGLHICLTVADTGHGIPAEIKSRIYEPFFSTKPAIPGVGMGLTLARSIIKSHAGAMDVQSVEGEGTTIRVYLPAASSE